MLTSIKLVIFQRTKVLFTHAILCKHAHETFEPHCQSRVGWIVGHCCPLKHYCSLIGLPHISIMLALGAYSFSVTFSGTLIVLNIELK